LSDGLSQFITAHTGSAGVPAIATQDSATAGKQVPAPASIDERRERLLNLIRAGESVSSAASKIGIDVATAQIWATQVGISINLRPKILKPDVRASLVKDLREGESKAAAANRYGVSVATVDKVLRTEVGLHAAWQAARESNAQSAARQVWLDLLDSDGANGIKLMRAMNPAAYAWLYRNDRTWLKEHLPPAGICAKPQRGSSVRWDQRDDDMSRAVNRVALQLSQEHEGKSIQLWQIYQVLPELRAKLPALERLPQTRRALEAALGRRRRKKQSTRLFD
jgi:transposase